jgi:hypothetical protein
MKPRLLKWCMSVGISLLVGAAVLAAIWFRDLGRRHRHCIKVAGSAFWSYAQDHGGALPFHTNGFGDALLLLVKGEYLPGVAWICGPGDDGTVLSNALVHGSPVPEAQCSRVYVQGLSVTNNPMIGLLFDRRSVPGGDHLYGHGRPVREVCMLDGSMECISDERWAEFSRQHVELLVTAGFKREKALQFYPEAPQPK